MNRPQRGRLRDERYEHHTAYILGEIEVTKRIELGAIFPQTEIGRDPAAIRDYAQAAESLGFDYILAFDHVVGANPASRPGWSGAYSHADSFHEPFVLFGYMAAAAEKIGFATGVVILPQRQTVLAAKQAAEVAMSSAAGGCAWASASGGTK